jgi:hypothetical protein
LPIGLTFNPLPPKGVVCVPWDDVKFYTTEKIVDRLGRKLGNSGMNTTVE